MTVMLIATVVLIYTRTAGGEEGTKEAVRGSGVRMAEQIARISP